jgi:hypothetical protein
MELLADQNNKAFIWLVALAFTTIQPDVKALISLQSRHMAGLFLYLYNSKQ